jgi:hypothetical protein
MGTNTIHNAHRRDSLIQSPLFPLFANGEFIISVECIDVIGGAVDEAGGALNSESVPAASSESTDGRHNDEKDLVCMVSATQYK